MTHLLELRRAGLTVLNLDQATIDALRAERDSLRNGEAVVNEQEDRRRPLFCKDLHDTRYCCDSCHVDEDEGYDTLWWDSWLHACCRATDVLEPLGNRWLDETTVRAFLAGRPDHSPSSAEGGEA